MKCHRSDRRLEAAFLASKAKKAPTDHDQLAQKDYIIVHCEKLQVWFHPTRLFL